MVGAFDDVWASKKATKYAASKATDKNSVLVALLCLKCVKTRRVTCRGCDEAQTRAPYCFHPVQVEFFATKVNDIPSEDIG